MIHHDEALELGLHRRTNWEQPTKTIARSQFGIGLSYLQWCCHEAIRRSKHSEVVFKTTHGREYVSVWGERPRNTQEEAD